VSHPFDARSGPILVDAEVTGPVRSMTVTLILDTGATTSLLKDSVLIALGFDLSIVTDRVQMTTGSAVAGVPRVTLTRLTAIGQHRIGLPVLAYNLHASVSVSGLLGLDFFRGQALTIDFRAGDLSIS
jgi:predicted aspartyl protease